MLEDLKLRFQISTAGSRALKEMLGTLDGSVVSDIGIAEDEEEAEVITEAELPEEEVRIATSLRAITPEATSKKDAEPFDKFKTKLLLELGKFKEGQSSKAACEFYGTWSAEDASVLKAAHAQFGLQISKLCSAVEESKVTDVLKSVKAARGDLLYDSKEVKVIVRSWLTNMVSLRGGATEARVSLAARRALDALEQDRFACEDVMAVAKAFDDHCRARSGGAGPALAVVRPEIGVEIGAVVVVDENFQSSTVPQVQLEKGQIGKVANIDSEGDALIAFSAHSEMQWVKRANFSRLTTVENGDSWGRRRVARRAAQESQILAHLVHSILWACKSWAIRGKSTQARLWMKRVAAVLRHVHFLAAHLEVAENALAAEKVEGAAADGSLCATEAMEMFREAIRDCRPVSYDKDSSLLLYFSGRLRRLEQPGLPSVLVLTCSFGGGHRAAAQAVTNYFSNRAEVLVVDTSKDSAFLEQDLMHRIGKRVGYPGWDQTLMFNDIILKRQLYGWVNFSEGFGRVQGAVLEDGRRSGIAPPLHSPGADSKLKRILRGQFLTFHPDLVVTVYHMDLNPIISLSEELGSLPIVHLATDLDVKMWEVFGRSPPTYPRFCVSVPFDLPLSWDSIAPLSPHQVFLAGYPVRAEFMAPEPTPEEIQQQRRRRGLVEGERLVLVMTGGGGQDTPWPEQLANSTHWGSKICKSNFWSSRTSGAKETDSVKESTNPEETGREMEFTRIDTKINQTNSSLSTQNDDKLRVVIVAGKNVDMVKRLQAALTLDKSTGLLHGSNPLVTVEFARDTTADASRPYFVGPAELAALMDVGSAAISKPGGGSTAELAYRGMPAVLDASQGAMHWEDFTIKRFEEAGRAVGLRTRTKGDLESALRQAIAMGRDSCLANDSSGRLLDTGQRLQQQAKALSGIDFDFCTFSV